MSDTGTRKVSDTANAVGDRFWKVEGGGWLERGGVLMEMGAGRL